MDTLAVGYRLGDRTLPSGLSPYRDRPCGAHYRWSPILCPRIGDHITFTLSFFALERWPTTNDYADFNQISSTLILGALCHKCLGVQEQDLMDDIQHAAFMTVVCARLRNHGKEILPANLEPVKHGLIVAQELMEYAYEHERQALINVLKHNTHETLAETPGLERVILGKHYEQVRQWEIEDDSLETAMKTGELPEPEETK